MSLDYLVGLTVFSSTSQYKVEKMIGEGSYGTVALCRKPFEEKVAIKFIDAVIPSEEAEKEAQILRELKMKGSNEFHIVDFRDSFTFNGLFCLEFEKLDIDLFTFCELQSLNLHQIRPVIKQVAEALCFLDDAGIVHTDLKPENIMLVDHQRQPLKIKIIDFGLAVRKPVKWTGKDMQTLQFRAPEVLLATPLSQAIDIWSVGCIAAELLTGTTLFPAKNRHHLMQLIVSKVGMPPTHFLDVGRYTAKYFFKESAHVWTPRNGGPRRPVNINQCALTSLDAILKLPEPSSAEEADAAECDRSTFVDLVVKMLCLNSFRRIKHQDVLQHPFLTMSHLAGSSSSSYLQASAKLLRPCSGGHGRAAPSSTREHDDVRELRISSRKRSLQDTSFVTKKTEISEEPSGKKKKKKRSCSFSFPNFSA